MPLSAYERNPDVLIYTSQRREPRVWTMSKWLFFNLQEKPSTVTSCLHQSMFWSKNQSPVGCFIYSYCSSLLINSSSGSFERGITACVEDTAGFQEKMKTLQRLLLYSNMNKSTTLALPALKNKNQLSQWQKYVFFLLRVTAEALCGFSTLLQL